MRQSLVKYRQFGTLTENNKLRFVGEILCSISEFEVVLSKRIPNSSKRLGTLVMMSWSCLRWAARCRSSDLRCCTSKEAVVKIATLRSVATLYHGLFFL